MLEVAGQDTLRYVYVALVIIGVGLWLLYRWRKRRSTPPTEPPTWDRHTAVQQLLAGAPELRRLYATLGYAPEFEHQCRQLLQALTALIGTEIQDFAAFYRTVHGVQAHLATLEHDALPHDLLTGARLRKARHDPLWQAVLAAGQDQVLALLNRDPVHERLPFIEQLPFAKDGQVVWRTSIEVPLIRKRPRDMARFSLTLDALEALFTAPPALLHIQARQQALDAMARLRREVQRPDGYLPTPLQALAGKITVCFQQAPNPTARRRRQALERFLDACVTLRHTSASAGTTATCGRREAQQHAQYYLQ